MDLLGVYSVFCSLSCKCVYKQELFSYLFVCLFRDFPQFRRLQGKQNRGKEEIKFLEIKGDDQLSGHQQWMMKNMTMETERKSFSKVRTHPHTDVLKTLITS